MKLILLNIINNATHTCYLLTQIHKQSISHLSLKKYTLVNTQTCSVAEKIEYPSHQVASVQAQE